jgi:hypothetical protein
MAAIFVGAIFLFAIPAWLPVVLNPKSWLRVRSAVIAFTVSDILQLVFVIGVGVRLFPLDFSIRFAAVGAPFCIVAMVLGVAGGNVGVIVSGFLSLLGWLFFILLH